MGILYKIAQMRKRKQDIERIEEWDIDNFTKFYMNDVADINGRRIKDILKYNQNQLECIHDYIQELFPTDEESFYNVEAPMFEKSELENIQKKHVVIRNNITSAYNMMVDFWGLRKEGYPIWFHDGDHNCLRVTRVLKSLNLFGCYDLADELNALLENKIAEFGKEVPVANEYWNNAATYKRNDLKERLESRYGKPLDEIKIQGEEWDAGKPEGDEVW